MKIIGELTIDEDLCSYLTKNSQIVEALDWLIINADCDVKRMALWVTCNIVCNSAADLNMIVESSILSNVCLCLQISVLTVQIEAYHVIASLLLKSNEILLLLKRYDILFFVMKTLKE